MTTEYSFEHTADGARIIRDIDDMLITWYDILEGRYDGPTLYVNPPGMQEDQTGEDKQ